MPRAASRCRRDQLVERLEALHTSIPNAGDPMAKTTFNHSQPAPAVALVPPIDRRRERAAEHPPRRLSPTAGDAASGTRPRPPFECSKPSRAPRRSCGQQSTLTLHSVRRFANSMNLCRADLESICSRTSAKSRARSCGHSQRCNGVSGRTFYAARRAQNFVNGFLSKLLPGFDRAVRIISMKARNVTGTCRCPG